MRATHGKKSKLTISLSSTNPHNYFIVIASFLLTITTKHGCHENTSGGSYLWHTNLPRAEFYLDADPNHYKYSPPQYYTNSANQNSRLPTSTSVPPTATLDTQGIERMKLCYEAATIVYADREALFMDDAWSRLYGHPDENAISALQAERKSRYKSLVQNIEKCLGDVCWDEDVLGVDGVIMTNADCLGYEKRIHDCNTFIQVIKITGGVGMTPSQSANMMCNNINKAAQTLKGALVTVYGVDLQELKAIADPIWQNVHARYGVVISEEN